MYDGKYIIPGLIIVLGALTFPLWWNLASATYEKPKLALPEGQTECVEKTETMSAEHMTMLDVWRDTVVREGKRMWTNNEGKVYEASLQKTCMDCHANKEEFCDKCHDAMSVRPYCWRCHIEPMGNE